MSTTDRLDANALAWSLDFPTRAQKLAQRLGLTNDRNIFFSWVRNKNFGDWITPYLFISRTNRMPYYLPPTRQPSVLPRLTTVSGAGSILRKIDVPDCVRVWGSGIIAADDSFARPAEVLAVRGPRTAARLEALGHPTTTTFGDPGLLLPEVYRPEAEARHRTGLLPHRMNHDRVAERMEGRDDTLLIDVRQPIERVVDQIRSCETLLSSSLHGLVVAHAYGVPAVWWESEADLIGDGTKFFDYFESVGETGVEGPVPVPTALTPDDLIAATAHATCPDVSPVARNLARACPFWGG